MRIHDALLVEGTSRFGILCYGVFPRSDLNSISEAAGIEADSMASKTHAFFEEDWPCCVLLIEVSTQHLQQIQDVVAPAFSRMFQSGTCLAALCMYDGAFGGCDGLFGADLADQTYAFCFSEGQYVVNFDTELLASNEWKQIIEKCRGRLEQSIRQSLIPE